MGKNKKPGAKVQFATSPPPKPDPVPAYILQQPSGGGGGSESDSDNYDFNEVRLLLPPALTEGVPMKHLSQLKSDESLEKIILAMLLQIKDMQESINNIVKKLKINEKAHEDAMDTFEKMMMDFRCLRVQQNYLKTKLESVELENNIVYIRKLTDVDRLDLSR